MIEKATWLQRIVLAISLVFTMLLASGKMRQNVLALRVIHGVMPLTLTMSGSDYLRGMLNALGLMKVESGRAFDLKYYGALESSAPDTADAHRLLGQYALLSVPAQLDLAETQFRLAAEKSPGDRMNLLWWGRAKWLLGETEEAVSLWGESIGPNFDLRLWLTQAIFRTGQVDLAIKSAVHLLCLPGTTVAQSKGVFEMLRWWTWWGSKTNADVIHISDVILSQTCGGKTANTLRMPPAANIMARRALAQLEANRLTDAWQELAQAAALADTPYVKAVRATLLFAGGDNQVAYQIIKEILIDNMDDPHAWLLAGKVLNGLGHRAEARQAWQRAERLSSNYQGPVQELLRQYP
ncbi:MAG: hypothetical protein IMZ61_02895 [Planctomycetes bacterium]|nr:hypothetical protein [Planctomycetota bacterium]